jgi:hypothetical protein
MALVQTGLARYAGKLRASECLKMPAEVRVIRQRRVASSIYSKICNVITNNDHERVLDCVPIYSSNECVLYLDREAVIQS